MIHLHYVCEDTTIIGTVSTNQLGVTLVNVTLLDTFSAKRWEGLLTEQLFYKIVFLASGMGEDNQLPPSVVSEWTEEVKEALGEDCPVLPIP